MPCKQEGKMIDFSHFAPFAIIVCEISEIFRIFATRTVVQKNNPPTLIVAGIRKLGYVL